ncbi:MAG: prolipoprotein diacylglyceryl transferase, partial [Defluviitaleaceae bacterium]|nr:prolipoprotein diacylglyceryl transferase [Defluviitaleaceae bacterium]
MTGSDIAFPNLNIEFGSVSQIAFTLPFFNLQIMWYGVFIALGASLGTLIAFANTKRNNLSKDILLDYAVIGIPVAIICTRLYYVLFNISAFRGDWMRIFAFRDGGMAVYGGIISAFATLYLFSKFKAKKLKSTTGEIMGKIGDCGVFALLLGQIIGRLGNFVNREAFGGYTDNLFAMQLPLSDIPRTLTTDEMLYHAVEIGGRVFIQV